MQAMLPNGTYVLNIALSVKFYDDKNTYKIMCTS